MIALSGIAIQSKIYESSASLVYRGIRVQDERSLIVKMLKLDYPSPQELTCYRQEYEITHSLKEEGVVKAYSQQEYQRTLVILLEDFGGESLDQWRHKRPDFCPMPLSMFLSLAIDLTDILGKIHAANIIHIAKPLVGPHDLNTTVPKAVSNIILKLMAKNGEPNEQGQQWRSLPLLKHLCLTLKLTLTVLGQCYFTGACYGC